MEEITLSVVIVNYNVKYFLEQCLYSLRAALQGMEQTRDWLQWLTALMQTSAAQGLDLSELLRQPVPERFAAWAAQPAELHRSLAQWYPRYERQALGARP